LNLEVFKVKGLLWVKGLAMILISLEIMGCSTLVGRQHDEQEVYFDSNVPDVEVTCSGRRTKTPGSLPLLQSRTHSCTAEHEGYQKKVFKIDSGLSWAGFAHSTALNTVATGWWTMGIGTGLGWLTDAASGAMKNLKKESVYLEMDPLKKKEAAGAKASS